MRKIVDHTDMYHSVLKIIFKDGKAERRIPLASVPCLFYLKRQETVLCRLFLIYLYKFHGRYSGSICHIMTKPGSDIARYNRLISNGLLLSSGL